ncbi:MAG: ABC transporter ATP-binding protein [Chloroflexi bacterium]|nr:MAG: ABC transporter ATP-binding protein [Chloroflexota bacterium]
MNGTPLLTTHDLRREFGGVKALDGVSLSVAAGERRAIIGPNGAGKTTLFNILTGELDPTSGSVALAGEDVTRRAPHELARRGVARMYQRNELFEPLAAAENVLLAVGAARGPYRPFTSPQPADRAAARELLARVGIAERADVAARSLSHGERRQLELALALAQRPRLLLLDEPTAGMSPAETARITSLIAALDRSLTVVIVEHDMDVVFRLADRISVLHEGRVLADGTPAEVRGDRTVNEVYLGKVVA